MTKKRTQWPAQDIKILRKKYPGHGAQIPSLLKKYTRSAILNRAYVENIKFIKPGHCKKCDVKLTRSNKAPMYRMCKACRTPLQRVINRAYETRSQRRQSLARKEKMKIYQKKYFKNYYLRVLKPQRQAAAKKRKLTKEHKK